MAISWSTEKLLQQAKAALARQRRTATFASECIAVQRLSADEKLRVLNEKFGLQDLKRPEHDLIEEELSNMDALTAAIRDDYDEKLERFHRIIAEKDSLIHEKDGLIHEKDGLINEKNELLSAKEKELSGAHELINMLRSKLAARDNS